MKFTFLTFKQGMKKERFALLFYLILITLIAGYFLKDAKTIRIIGDEFGYWSAGAYFSGLHWEPVASLNTYYGFGYGFILSLIFNINFNIVTSFQLAIIINIVLLCFIFLLINRFINSIAQNVNTNFIRLLSFCATIYPSNLVFSQFTMTEILITFLFWIIINCITDLIKKPSFFSLMILSTSGVYLYYVHQRTLGVCFAIILFLFFYLIKNRRKKNVYFVYIYTIFIIILGNHIKNDYQDVYLLANSNPLLALNDYSGQVGKLKALLSISGMLQLIKSIGGKIFYAGASTFLLSWIGFYVCIMQIMKDIRNKTIEDFTILKIFLILSSILSLGICSIYMLQYNDRLDMLFYGRYFEFSFIPLFIYACVYLYENPITYKMFSWSIMIFMLISSIICILVPFNSTGSNMFINAIGISDIYFLYSDSIHFWFLLIAKTIFIFALIVFCFKNRILKYQMIILSIISIVFLFNYYTVYEKGVLNWGAAVAEGNINLAEYIEKNSLEDSIVYYTGDDGRMSNSSYLQFLLPNNTIESIHDISDYALVEKDKFLLTPFNTTLQKYLMSKYCLLGYSGELKLWASKDNGIAIQGLYEEFVLDTNAFKSDSNIQMESDNDAQIIEILLDCGTYEVIFDFSLDSQISDSSYCEVVLSDSEEILGHIDLEKSEKNERFFTAKTIFSLYENETKIQFKIFDGFGNGLNINNVSYQKIDNNYWVGLGDYDIELFFKNLYGKDHSISKIVYVSEPYDQVSIDYLQEKLLIHDIEKQSIEKVVKEKEKSILLIAKYNKNWMLLLDNYSIIKALENFYVLIPSDSHLNNILSEDEILSQGREIDMSLFQKKAEKGYFVNQYSIPQGIYTLKVKLLERQVEDKKLIITIRAGDRLWQTEEFSATELLYIPLDLEEDEKISIEISSKDGNKIDYQLESLNVLKNYFEYKYEESLVTLLSMVDKSVQTIAIIEDAFTDNSKELRNYFTANLVQQPIVISSYFAYEDWIEYTLSYDALILPSDLELIWPLLEKGYSVIGANSGYCYLYRGTASTEPLSNELRIGSEYFNTVGEGNILADGVSISKGIFHLSLNFEFDKSILKNNQKAGVLKIYNGKKLMSNREINAGDTNVILTISDEKGIDNLIVVVNEYEQQTVKYELDYIEKISNGWMVDLENMRVTQDFDLTEENKIIVRTQGLPTTIFGPYASLEVGKYEIHFEFLQNPNSIINFDVSANAGDVITMSDSRHAFINELGYYEVVLPVEFSSLCNEVEFRSYIPEHDRFTLVNITVVPIE